MPIKALPRRMLRFWLFALGSVLTYASVVIAAEEANNPPPLSDYIRPLVGTQGEGNTYPGPTAPFGMVQPGPDTERARSSAATIIPIRRSSASA